MLLANACGRSQSYAVGLQKLIAVRVSITLSTAGGSPKVLHSPYLVYAAVKTAVRLLFPAHAEAQHMCSAWKLVTTS